MCLQFGPSCHPNYNTCQTTGSWTTRTAMTAASPTTGGMITNPPTTTWTLRPNLCLSLPISRPQPRPPLSSQPPQSQTRIHVPATPRQPRQTQSQRPRSASPLALSALDPAWPAQALLSAKSRHAQQPGHDQPPRQTGPLPIAGHVRSK